MVKIIIVSITKKGNVLDKCLNVLNIKKKKNLWVALPSQQLASKATWQENNSKPDV